MFKRYLVIFFMVLSLGACATTAPTPVTSIGQEMYEENEPQATPDGTTMTKEDAKAGAWWIFGFIADVAATAIGVRIGR